MASILKKKSIVADPQYRRNWEEECVEGPLLIGPDLPQLIGKRRIVVIL